MSRLELILLGQFECLLPSGSRISLSMRKAEVLLAYLALTPGLRHPRERLINLLWSDRSEEQARNSLRQCLSAIKKSLGDVADMVLLVDRTTVTLIPELIDIDVHEFERLATEGDYESLATAADLYQGEFLEGISIRDAACQEWLDSERGRFKRQFIEILANLAETQLLSHDFSHAIKSAERLVKQDPLGEAGWRLLMRSYHESGDRSHALQAFKRCQQALRDELDVDPEAATIELRDQFADGTGKSKPPPIPAVRKSPVDSAASTDHSIAVLPFDNLSGDPEQEYFSDGITDSIILNLSLFPGLQVKSRNSSFAFKQQIKSLGEISTELNVDYIVEGSIRKSVDRIRITVQLVDASEGNQIWGKRYDADIDNLFDLEEELSRTIAATVTGQIESDLQRISLAKGAADQQAYDLLMQGTYLLHRSTAEDTARAIASLNQCLASDPDNVRAHGTLYGCHILNWMERWLEDYEPSFKLAGKHVAKAVALDSESGMANYAFGEFMMFSRSYAEADQYFDKALAINPSDPDALTAKAVNLQMQGHLDAAYNLAQEAYRLDPYNWWADWNLAEAQYLKGHYQDAIETIENSRNAPGFIKVYAIASHVKLGNRDEAGRVLQEFLSERRSSMAAFPTTQEDWLLYTTDTAPFVDQGINRGIVDCLLQAGLDSELLPASIASNTGDQPSILVLPFSNLSGDPEQEYFSNGITESVILNLGSFSGINVKSRHASFAFKDSARSIDEIAAELGVQYIVEGSIRRFGDKVRITAQLADTVSGNQVWGKRYDYDLDDLFALEEELSLTIAGTVSGRVDKEAKLLALRKPAKDLKSYDYFLRAIHHVEHFNTKDINTGIELFKKCLALDPGNVMAHATLGSTYMVQLYENCAEDRAQTRKLMLQHLERALELDPGNAITHSYLAEALHLSKDFERGVAHARKAVKLNPTLADGHAMLSLFASTNRQHDEAIKQADLSLQIDPFHPWIGWNAGEIYRNAEDYERAIDTFRALPHLSVSVHAQIAACLAGLGRLDEAQEEMRQYLALAREQMIAPPANKDEWYRFWDETMPYRHQEDTDRYFDLLVLAGLCDQPELAIDSNHSIAVLPFDNLSGDPAQEYFSDGITESIILNLSLFPGLNVKSRNSSFAFKQQLKGIGEISKELEVDYLVEGSIRKSADRVRVTVQLVDATSGNQVWGKRYDAEIEDLFDLEEDLSRTIATTVTGQIESDLQRIAIAKGAAHQQSYDLLLQGIYHCKKSTAAGMAIAVEKLNQCLELDPNNALAHATLYACHELNWIDRWVADFEASRKLCKEHATRALALNPELGQCQVVFAEYLIFNREFGEAEAHVKRALEINPNDSEAIAVQALNLSSQGKFEAALEKARLALQLDPYHTWARWILTESQFFCGLYEDALATISNTGNPPGFVQIYKIAANTRLGRMEIARDTLKGFLQHCRESMSSMPRSIDEWLAYSRDNAPFADPAFNQKIIDYLVQAGLEEEMVTAQKIADPEALPSIAVLPFENMSGDPEQEYFSDGITSSLILSLGLYNGLAVKSQNSSFAYKNSGKSSEEVAAALKATYLVEGSIRKSASNIRITVQLIESASGNQIWGQQYDSKLDDVLDLEQELSQTIAATISGRIGHKLQQSAARKPAKDLQSYDYLLRGLYHLGKFSANDLEIAKQETGKCLEIDPDNAAAHFNLGEIHFVEALEGWTEDRHKSGELAGQHLETALRLEPDNAPAHAYMADYLNWVGDFGQSEFHADKAIELNPTAAEGYFVKADVLRFTRRIEQAIPYADKSLQLDPHSVGAGWAAGGVYQAAGQYDKAIKTFRSISHPPASIYAQIAACFIGLGSPEEARKEMKRYQQLARQQMSSYPESEAAWRLLWRDYSAIQFDEDFDDLFDLLKQAGLCEDLFGTDDDIPSIAVLPFENMSGDPEQEHFSDGITTDIIATLSTFGHMRTISRYSILQYKNQHTSIPDIAQQQNVRYILEGSVRKSGNSIRVSAELIDSQDGKICWSERYDRDLDDLFAVQDEITRNIALAMKVQLDDGDMAVHRSTGTSNIKAWQLTLAATDLMDTYIRENILEARRMVKQAIDLDPDYPYAWVALGWTFWSEVYSGWSSSPEDSLVEAEKAQQKALDLVPLYSEAWTLGGMIHLMRHEPTEALEYCRKAVELEPGNAEIQALMAFCLIYVGDYENARQHEQTMMKLCPVLPAWYYLVGGEIAQKQGDYASAAHQFQQGIDVEPDSPLCRFYLINLMMQQGNETRARELANEIKALDKQARGRGLVRTFSQDKTMCDRFRANLEKFDLY